SPGECRWTPRQPRALSRGFAGARLRLRARRGPSPDDQRRQGLAGRGAHHRVPRWRGAGDRRAAPPAAGPAARRGAAGARKAAVRPLARALAAASTALLAHLVAAVPARAVELTGSFVQGGLVQGRAQPGAEVRLDDAEIPVAPDGRFLFGFGRDAGPEL